MRMASTFHVGEGLHSMDIKAAPGDGVATTYYLSNNGGLYDKTKRKPWVEIDFEIMGRQAKEGSTRIWTNLFTGIGVEHNQMITVPFDVTAGYHSYAFELTDTSVAWIVDGVTYRKVTITGFPDVVSAIQSSALQELASVWGKSKSDAGEGIPAFREALGTLDSNSNKFPLQAFFKRSTTGEKIISTAYQGVGPLQGNFDGNIEAQGTQADPYLRGAFRGNSSNSSAIEVQEINPALR